MKSATLAAWLRRLAARCQPQTPFYPESQGVLGVRQCEVLTLLSDREPHSLEELAANIQQHEALHQGARWMSPVSPLGAAKVAAEKLEQKGFVRRGGDGLFQISKRGIMMLGIVAKYSRSLNSDVREELRSAAKEAIERWAS